MAEASGTSGGILPYSSDSESAGEPPSSDKRKESSGRHGRHREGEDRRDGHSHKGSRHRSPGRRDRDDRHHKPSRRRSRSRSRSKSPSYRHRRNSHHRRRRSRSSSWERRRRSRSPSWSPPRRRGRGRGPITPTVGQIPPQPKAMVRDSFTAPAAPSVSQLNQMEATTLEWLQQEAERVSSQPVVQPPPPVALPDVLTSEERVAAAKAAATRLAAKLPSQSAVAQPQGEPAKQQALVDKKKLLWASKKKEDTSSTSQWDFATFSDDSEGAKFRRLMGMGGAGEKEGGQEKEQQTREQYTKAMEDMERQYEMSRFQTHVGKGLGLGYSNLPPTTSD